MAKLGLCVRYDCNNYGSMLQILATQRVVDKYDYEYELIRYDKKTLKFYLLNSVRLFNPYFMKGKLLKIAKKIKIRKYSDVQIGNNKRILLFKKFREENLGPYSPIFKGYSKLREGAKRYEVIMVGSDQLWTPAGLNTRFYNLLFVPNKIKKVSLATSFGVVEIPKLQVNKTRKYLDRIEYLSVRELAGKKIVKELTGRDVLVALDPTLLLKKTEWDEIIPYNRENIEPYIFAYFLGTNSEHREIVELLYSKTGYRIITCPHMDEFVSCDLEFGHEKRFDVDPVGFLNLIRNAEYICTDSFHGTIFSIIYHKKFLTFDRYQDRIRKSKNSRIDSLFDLLNLSDRRFGENYKNDILGNINKEINYDFVDSRLLELQKDTFIFLDEALKK